jgi:hypothetical protein
VTWYYNLNVSNIGPSWELWADFRKAEQGRAAEAIITLPGGREHGLGWGLGDSIALWQQPTSPGHRSVPLAVHGPLVEFERRLYTATIRTEKIARGSQPARETLHLGSAIELKDRVWYQAGTSVPNDKGLCVEEWRIEFQNNPRTEDRGTATLRGHWRVVNKPEGESFDAVVTFHAGKTYTGGRTVTLNWPTGMRQTRSLPQLEIDDPQGGTNIMWLDKMHRLSLQPASKPRPQLLEQSGLMQPPTQKSGK